MRSPNLEFLKRLKRRRVHIVIARQNGGPDMYMDLCSQCLRKRRKKAAKRPWNRSIYHGSHYPPEEYKSIRVFSYLGRPEIQALADYDTTNLKCQDCGWTAKGR